MVSRHCWKGHTQAPAHSASALEKMLDESDPDVMQPHAKRLKVTKSSNPTSLDDLRPPDWQLEEVSIFPLSHSDPWDTVALPDGRVAVGYWDGKAIELFAADGPQVTVLRGVKVFRVSSLSDGRFVVRDNDNNAITLYTQAWERLDIKFDTRAYSSKGGLGGICVDRDDNIYVSYWLTKKIVVFRPEGGAPRRIMHCHDSTPWEIFHMNHMNRLVVCDGSRSVRIIDYVDEEGDVLHDHTQMEGHQDTCIAVLKDDSILIACRKDALMSVDLYTKDLKRIRTVLRDFSLAGEIRKLVELSSGDIAVVSDNQFIVFHKI